MATGSLHSLFERLLGEDTVPADGHARRAADLAARLDDGGDGAVGAAAPEPSAAVLAAYLDGGMDQAAQQDVQARLARSPAAYQEADSADAFLDAVAGTPEKAPADLVAAVITRVPASTSRPPPTRRSSTWTWLAAVAVLAAAVAVVLVVSRRPQAPGDSSVPVAKIAPVPAPQTPVMADKAGKGAAAPGPVMAPAGSEQTVPGPDSGKRRPSSLLAPEGMETVPAPMRRHREQDR